MSRTLLLFPLRGPRYLASTTYDVAVFQNIEAAVDEAFDVVCNGGLDIGDLAVEREETDDEEQMIIARFFWQLASC